MDYNSSNVMIISKITVNLRLNQQLKYIIAKNCVLPFKKWVYLNHEGRFGFNSGSRTKSNSKGKLYLLILPRGVYILCLLENNGGIAARVIIYKGLWFADHKFSQQPPLTPIR